MASYPQNWGGDWEAPKVTLGEIIWTLKCEARVSSASHAACVARGKAGEKEYVSAPDPRVLKRIMALHKAAEFLEQVEPVLTEVRKLIAANANKAK